MELNNKPQYYCRFPKKYEFTTPNQRDAFCCVMWRMVVPLDLPLKTQVYSGVVIINNIPLYRSQQIGTFICNGELITKLQSNVYKCEEVLDNFFVGQFFSTIIINIPSREEQQRGAARQVLFTKNTHLNNNTPHYNTATYLLLQTNTVDLFWSAINCRKAQIKVWLKEDQSAIDRMKTANKI